MGLNLNPPNHAMVLCNKLIARIEDVVSHYHADCQPFAWIATADSILQKINRLCKYISGTQH